MLHYVLQIVFIVYLNRRKIEICCIAPCSSVLYVLVYIRVALFMTIKILMWNQYLHWLKYLCKTKHFVTLLQKIHLKIVICYFWVNSTIIHTFIFNSFCSNESLHLSYWTKIRLSFPMISCRGSICPNSSYLLVSKNAI